MSTLTKRPPPLSFSDLTFYYYSLEAYTAISLLLQHHMAPPPSLPQLLGGVREMHNQCNIHGLKNYCTDCFFFLLLICVCTFPPFAFAFNLFVQHVDIPQSCGYLFIYCLCLKISLNFFFLHIQLGLLFSFLTYFYIQHASFFFFFLRCGGCTEANC